MNPIGSLAASLDHPISIPRDILHTWWLKEYTVHLFIEENILKCQMIDHSGREVYKAKIDVPANYTLEKMIANLKQCKIILKNQVPNFRLPVNTWHVENKEVHLLPDTDHLVWNIVQESNTENLFFPFEEVTIPSERCHLETVALIEKIKADSLNRVYKNYLKNDFQVVRVLTPEEIPKEIRQNEKAQVSLLNNQEKEMKSHVNKGLAIGTGTGSAALYLSWNAIGAATATAASWLGSGTVATLATGALGVGLGTASFGLGMALPLFHFMPKIESLYTTEMGKARHVANHINELIIERPLFVEIEPISFPSEIDDRMLVSKFTWAVTLVTYRGSFHNHAQIVVEGLNDGYFSSEGSFKRMKPISMGEKFVYLSELNPPVQSGLLPPGTLKFVTRTEMWMRSSSRVKKMIDAVEEDKKLPNGYSSFNSTGKHSLLYKVPFFNECCSCDTPGDNCFTWARDKLQIANINLGEGLTEFIITIPRTYTKVKEAYTEIPKQMI